MIRIRTRDHLVRGLAQGFLVSGQLILQLHDLHLKCLRKCMVVYVHARETLSTNQK